MLRKILVWAAITSVSVLAAFGSVAAAGATTKSFGYSPISATATVVTLHPSSAPPTPCCGGGGYPSVTSSGACGTVTLEAVPKSYTAAYFIVYIYPVADITSYSDVNIYYDVEGGPTGNYYFEPLGTSWSSTSPTLQGPEYADVSAEFSGFTYLNGIGWCYFNTPDLNFQI